MKNLYKSFLLILLLAFALTSCSGGGGAGGTVSSGDKGIFSKTTTVSGTVFLSGAVATSSKASFASSYKVTASGSHMDKVLTASGVKNAVLPPLVNATVKLYNADRPDWVYPVAQVFTGATGTYIFNKLTNADLNVNASGQQEYSNGDPIPSGNYTVIAANDTTVSGGKQYVAVQAIVKKFEGKMEGNDLVVQDSDALPAVAFMLGLKPNDNGTFGGTGTILPPNAGIQIVFNMAMARLSVIDAVKVYPTSSPSTPLSGTWKFSPDLLTATFYPASGMHTSTAYTVKVAGGASNVTAAVNVYGKQLPSTVVATFTTDTENDTTKPNAILYQPFLQTDVPITTPIQIASRYEPLDINTMVVTGTPSIGDKPAVHYVGIKQLPLGPNNTPINCYIYEIGHTPLDLGIDYVITVSDAKDMSGNLLQTVSFNFKTESTSNGITGGVGTALRSSQIAVKDVFGKWINAMNTRNATLLTAYMTGDFFWLVNGWSEDDLNRDGRLNLNEFRDMLAQSFDTYDYCDISIDGDTSSITIDGSTASIVFTLTTTAHKNLADPECANSTRTMYADLKNINSAWLIYRGADSLPTSYPAALDVIELSAPGNGAQYSEPLVDNPLYPNFVWKAVPNVTTYAVVLMEAGSSDTGWVALIDGTTVAAGDPLTFTYTPTAGYADAGNTKYVLASGQPFGFSQFIKKMKPGGYYHWAVLGFKTHSISDFDLKTVTDPAADLGASSATNNFSVANNVPPSVTKIVPENATKNVSTHPTITVFFSEAMLASSITNTTFKVVPSGGQAVQGEIKYAENEDSYTATFVPSGLSYDTEYTVSLTTGVKDIAGNSLVAYSSAFTTDKDLLTTASPAGGSYNSNINVSLSANKDVKYIKYSTTVSSPTTTYTGPIELSSNGTTTLKFFAEDMAGNKESVRTAVYKIDSTKPITSVTPTGGYFNTTPVTVNMTTNKADAKIYYTTDGSEPSTALTGYASVVTSLTGTGTKQLRFFAVDSIGNAENIRTETYIIDTAPPGTDITTFPDNPTRSKYANFTFSSNETDVTFECNLNSGGWSPCTSPYSQVVSQGTNTFSVRAKDRAGNYDSTPATYTWIYDVTPPTGSIGIVDLATDTTKTTTTNTAVKLRINATDTMLPVDQMQLSHDGQAWYDPVSYTGVDIDWTLSSGDGTKAAFVRFKDTAGNWSGPYGDTIVLDQTRPDTSIIETPPSVSGTTVTFKFSATEPEDHFTCTITDTSTSQMRYSGTCTSPYVLTAPVVNGSPTQVLTDGNLHKFEVYATDKAGLDDQTPASYSWKVDTNALVTQASKVGGLYNYTFSVTLTPTGTACSTTTYYCTGSDCTPATSGTGPISINATTTLRYYSVETGGGACTENESDPAPFGTGIKEQVYTIDTTAPETTITSGPIEGSTIASSSATFYFSSEAGATFQCKLDKPGVPGSYTTCSSPITYTGLADGLHTFAVKATDTAGNTDLSAATRSWTVDLTGPTGGSPAVSINNNATYTNSTGVTLTLNASDSSGISYVLISNDGNTWYWYSWPYQNTWYLPSGDGTKVVYVQFRDTLGNMSSTYSDSIILDTVPPNTTISSGPGSPTTSRTVTFYFYSTEAGTFECSLDNQSWGGCSSPYTMSVLNLSGYPEDGTFTLHVRARDNSGQADPSPAYYTWTLFTGYWDSPGVWDWSKWGN